MEGFARLNSDKILSVTYTSTAEKELLVFCIPKSKALRYRCKYRCTGLWRKPICPSPYLYFSGSFVIFNKLVVGFIYTCNLIPGEQEYTVSVSVIILTLFERYHWWMCKWAMFEWRHLFPGGHCQWTKCH